MLAAMGCAPLLADEKTNDRLDDAASLFSEIMGTPDKSIPQDLLDKSACVVLVPGLKKAGFVVGGKFGRGYAVCRAASGQGWGPPAAMRIEGGSFRTANRRLVYGRGPADHERTRHEAPHHQ